MKYKRRDNGEIVKEETYTKLVVFPREAFRDRAHELQIVSVPPHTSIAPHHHTIRTEVFYVLEGEAYLRVGDEEHLAVPGDAFICEPGERHYARNTADTEFRLLVLKLDLTGEDETVWSDGEDEA